MSLLDLSTKQETAIHKPKKLVAPGRSYLSADYFDTIEYQFVNEANSKMLHSLELYGYPIVLKTKGNFAMHDLLLRIMEEFANSAVLPSIYLSTFSMTEMSARVLGTLKADNKLNELVMLMDKESRTRYPQVHQIISNIATAYALTNIHAKLLIVSNGIFSFSVIGSANWTKNPRIECVVINQCNLLNATLIESIINDINALNGY